MRRLLALLLFVSATALTLPAQEFLFVPFVNKTGVSGLDWIGESTSETLREVFVSNGLPVVERDEREEAAQKLHAAAAVSLGRAALLRIGEQLGCGHIVYGEVGKSREQNTPPLPEGRVRLTARLIDLDHFAAVQTVEEEGSISQLSAIEALLAWRLLRHVRPDQAPSKEDFMKSYPLVRVEAAESFVHGLQASNPEQKHRYFTQAVLLDPQFSQPCFQLGLMQWEERIYRVAVQWLEKVARHDAHYFEANYLLGLCRRQLGDDAGAVQAFQIVARKRPANEVLNNLAVTRLRNKDSGAWESLWKVLQAEPDDPDYQFNAGYLLWKQGDLQGAEERFRETLALDPGDVDAQLLLDRCIAKNGPRPGDLSDDGLERLKENYQSAGISRWPAPRNGAE